MDHDNNAVLSGAFAAELVDVIGRLSPQHLTDLASYDVSVRCRPMPESPATYGICWWRKDGARLIEFNAYLPQSAWNDTILHEIAHALIQDEKDPHGDRWQRKARELGAIPVAVHESGEFEYPMWRFACTNPRCGEVNELLALDGPEREPTMDDLIDAGCDGCWEVPDVGGWPDIRVSARYAHDHRRRIWADTGVRRKWDAPHKS